MSKLIPWMRVALLVSAVIAVVLPATEVRGSIFWTLIVVGIACLAAGAVGLVADVVLRWRG